MKLRVVAEGEYEIGGLLGQGEDGVAAVWLRRLLGADVDAPLELAATKLSSGELSRQHRARGEAATAATAYKLACSTGADGLVLFRDADNTDDERRDELAQGFAAAAANSPRAMPAVLGLQVNMLEAWLLADAGAFERAFGRARPDLPRAPEELWGKRQDPQSNHPHQLYPRVLRSIGVPPTRAAAVRLAEHIDLDVLTRECPRGFGAFRADFERAFRPFDSVVAADAADGIGKDNGLPWPRLKGDLRHFREVTSKASPGKRNAILMGRKTWDSIPAKQQPLPDRWNVVISRGRPVLPEGVGCAGSLDEALTLASLAPDIDRIFVIGGGEIYRQAFAHPRCRNVYLTRLDGTYDCDAFIPPLGARFACVETVLTANDSGVDYTVGRWRRGG